MTNRKNVTMRIMTAAGLGVSLLGSAVLFAQDRVERTGVPATEQPRVTNPGVSGGYYNDRHDWYYDFYTSDPDARPVERPRFQNADNSFRTERDRLSDAARPSNSRWNAQRRTAQDNFYSRYYDEPWFYKSHDQTFGMPMTSTWDERFRTPGRDEAFIQGTVAATKFVRNIDSGGQNAVALVRPDGGAPMIVDLGPSQKTLDFWLTQGDRIQVRGQRETIGPYSVLMARDIQSGVNRVKVQRESWAREADYRLIDGRIEEFRDIRVRHNQDLHRVAALQTSDGRVAIVDLGPSSVQNVPANAAPGDTMTASGQVVQVGNYPILIADRISINNDIPLRVGRADNEYVDPARRPYEVSQEESATNPTCVGGGCEAGTVGRSTPRNPLSNAMSGDIGSEGR
jgi:hypothetical protein